MAITHLLLNKLIQEANQNEELANELEKRLEEKPIHLKLPKKKEDEKIIFSERISNARIQRPECLRIIEHQDILMDVLDKLGKKVKELNDMVKLLWKQWWCLLTIVINLDTNITKKEWIQKRRIFGNLFTTRYQKKMLLPIFIYLFIMLDITWKYMEAWICLLIMQLKDYIDSIRLE